MESQQIVAFEVRPGSSPLLVEASIVPKSRGGQDAKGYKTTRIARGSTEVVVGQASQSLESAVAEIRPGVRAMLDQFLALGPEVKKLELEVGIKLTAEAGAIIAKTSGEGHCLIRLTFMPDIPGVAQNA